jgi:hypothetical protein
MTTQIYNDATGKVKSFSAQNVEQNILSSRDYLLRDGIDDLATYAIGVHSDKVVFYIHMSLNYSKTLFR